MGGPRDPSLAQVEASLTLRVGELPNRTRGSAKQWSIRGFRGLIADEEEGGRGERMGKSKPRRSV
jgi:hypothetical protein